MAHQDQDLGQELLSVGGGAQREDTNSEANRSSAALLEAPSPPARGWGPSHLLLQWVFPLMRHAASTNRLEPSEVWTLPPGAEPDCVYDSFIAAWRTQAPAGPGGNTKGRAVLRTLARVHFNKLQLFWMARILQTLLGFCFPLFLNLLTRFVNDRTEPLWKGMVYALCLFLAQYTEVIVSNNADVGLESLALRVRSSLITAILRKVLVLRQDALLGFSTGRLNNMITTDVDKAKRVVRYMHVLLLTAPINIIVSLVGLHHLVGVSTYFGLGWMAFIILLNPAMMTVASKWENKQQKKTDERVRIATEIISSIQVVKCYAWERAASSKVETARVAELHSMWRLYIVYTVFEGLWTSVVPISTAVTFASYTLLNPDTPLTAAQAFTAMSLIDTLNAPLFQIPWVLNLIVEALVAARRMERLFILPEADLPSRASIDSFLQDATANSPRAALPDTASPKFDEQSAVNFKDASFVWPRSQRGQDGDSDEEGEDAGDGADGQNGRAEESSPGAGSATDSSGGPCHASFRLADLTFCVPHGAFVGVVGATASGKTSLLQAILGEMPLAEEAARDSVMVRRTKPIAFAPQQPWIFNSTVRQNILFGEPYHQERYTECVRSCGLEKDLALLKSGDQTKVGEKGIALSGGQKARVCLARAAYRQSIGNLFLLDDPYSALDAHVAQSVHEEAIVRLLAKKTRIVVTNRLEFVCSCDYVIVLDKGRIEAIGSYDEVTQSSPSLRALLAAQGLTVSTPTGPMQPSLDRAISYESAEAGEDQATREMERHTGEAQAEEEEQEEEARASGQLQKEVLFYYLRNMGGPWSVSLLATLYAVAEVIMLSMPLWVAYWTACAPSADELGFFIGIYSVLSILSVVSMCGRDMMGNIYGFRAARRLHRAMFAAVLRAPMSFFQDTPHGRIVNRFSKDISEIDKELIWQMIYTVVPVLELIGNFALVGSIAYFAIIAFLPAFWLYYLLWKYYNRAAMDLKRISKVTSSPVYDHFNNLCRENAISVVRAHHQAERQCHTNSALLTEQQRPEYAMVYIAAWFSMRVSHLGNVLVLLVSLTVVLGRGHLLSASTAALVLSFSNGCSGSIESLIGKVAEFGMSFNCVERVMEYATTLPSEAPLLTDRRPPAEWPSAGILDVQNLRLRYRPQLPLVLKGLSFSTQPGEHIGVVGRTGAGKSSLLLALLRVVEPEEGSAVLLDGQDLLKMGLEDLRSNIAMIPQDPVLFQESLRYNCDPFGQHTDQEVWGALTEAQLSPWLREQQLNAATGTENGDRANPSPEAKPLDREGASSSLSAASGGAATSAEESAWCPSPQELTKLLQWEVKENGQNLSAGQRQLVAIARAVLRSSKLIVLDEATAALDAATDAAIQKAIRRCFHSATTLTIAHRLRTIMDSDRVIVLADGEIAEIDNPSDLRAKSGGIFRSMVEEAEGR